LNVVIVVEDVSVTAVVIGLAVIIVAIEDGIDADVLFEVGTGSGTGAGGSCCE